MNTLDLLKTYQRLVSENKLDEAKMLVEANGDNKRFVSLVQLREEFLTGFDTFLKERIKDAQVQSR